MLDSRRPLKGPAPAVRAEGRAAPGRLARLAGLCGPAFVVSVAYIDPGNFATNMAGGAQYGTMLLWVIALANVLAMFVQALSAKLGIATGRNLPELCRDHLPRRVSLPLWVQAELVAAATDLAEFIGGAIALNLLFGVPLLPAAAITAVVSSLLLMLAPRGRRRFEATVAAMLGVVLAGFAYQVLLSGSLSGVAGGFVPRLAGTDSLLLATGIVGATVMPHVVYLHSALTQHQGAHGGPGKQVRSEDVRREAVRREAVRASRVDIAVALGAAGLVNMAMLTVAAVTFGGGDPGSLQAIHAGLGQVLGPGAAVAFALALLASGLASSSVGTYAGQVIMAGFLRRRVPLLARRLVTIIPAMAVLAAGVDPTRALVLSQVALSFGIPFALVPLVAFTGSRKLMGELVNRRLTTVAGVAVAAVISALNGFLLVDVFSG
ncbi:manganese transport protein [Microbispora rosea]|uniref:Divalent metal cation transporter MntH n=1 Tax=Microbispora rosea TaxID=58117 RepID=A0A1N6R3V0_9ACTN|nr:Nramp family divalent metal transporter [Microbispora rosea]GIH45659.1 divalent metal cation transporter MntH [Microbispora rosea subsp. rosea]SIQ23600.1 manganese transport protein [Microbispora rosea]